MNISKLDYELLSKKYKNLDKVLKKIESGYPVQYLIGNVDFYGYKIKVTPSVLIPRFETETLVEKTIDYINKLGLNKGKIIDIGTGSGCISIALKKEINSLDVTAIDNSLKALRVAKYNAKLNNANINFKFKNLFKYNLKDKFDIIISNPPYITYGDNVSLNTKYEPYNAIYVDKDPLKYYEEIFKIGLNSLNQKYLIALEIDEEQGDNLVKLSKMYYPNSKISLEKDLTDRDRYLFIINE